MLIAAPGSAFASPQAPDAAKIDAIVNKVMARDDQPGLSIIVDVRGRTYAHGYGYANIADGLRVTPSTRFKIGSNSKQFTATAILMLAEQGKLSLGDRVAKYFPSLPHGQEVTIRELLTHTSGYTDYAPLDFFVPQFANPIDPHTVALRYASKPLDFTPGTQWQYSNTGYTILGNIFAKVSGEPLGTFLTREVFPKAGMTHTHYGYSPSGTATGYTRFMFSHPYPAPTEAPGWINSAGYIESTPQDLEKWNDALFAGKILQPKFLRMMTRPVVLPNGKSTHYGFGLFIESYRGHRLITHGGEVSGQVSQYLEFPDDGITVVMLTNSDFFSMRDLQTAIENAIFGREAAKKSNASPRVPQNAADVTFVRSWLSRFASGKIDRAAITPDFNAYLTPQVVAAGAQGLTALGTPGRITEMGRGLRGGMTFSYYTVEFLKRQTIAILYRDKAGKIAEFLLV